MRKQPEHMKLKDFIICDDIRMEINNKVSLIGVYNDALHFMVPERAISTWPKILRLGFFIRLVMEDPEEQRKIGKLVIESSIDGEINYHAEQIVDTKKLEPTPVGQMIISSVFNNINIPKKGDMELTLAIFNRKNELMDKFNYPGNLRITEILQKIN